MNHIRRKFWFLDIIGKTSRKSCELYYACKNSQFCTPIWRDIWYRFGY